MRPPARATLAQVQRAIFEQCLPVRGSQSLHHEARRQLEAALRERGLEPRGIYGVVAVGAKLGAVEAGGCDLVEDALPGWVGRLRRRLYPPGPRGGCDLH